MQDNTTVNERMLEVVEALKLNNNSFSIKTGVAPSVIGNITGGRKGKPSFELLEKIGIAFPEISMEWLVRGEGTMFRGEIGESECQKRLRVLTGKYNDLEEDFERVNTQLKRLKS